MLTRIERQLVENARSAGSISITCNEGRDNETTFVFDGKKYNIKKLAHDLALAIQDFYGANEGGKK